MSQDHNFMTHALGLAARGLGNVWPNPAVGCVVVKNGRVVGRGWTAPGGRPHAETQALAQAGELARGATAYVTLEPCAHHGKTPPCANALIQSGISRVVCAASDPDPRVAGKGFQILREGGIEVVQGVLQDHATLLNRGFFSRVQKNRPLVTLKLAGSFDGRIATATGESKWITGPYARRRVHAMRANHDAVMVGGGTVRADDPSLTVRDLGIDRQPVRVVLSRKLDIPTDGQLGRTAHQHPVWIVHGAEAPNNLRQAWRKTDAELIELPPHDGWHLDAGLALSALADRGLTRVFCEGGGALAASLLSEGLVDDLIGFTAGRVIGAEGLPQVGALGLAHLADAPTFDLVNSTVVDGDVMHVWRRRD